MGCISYSPAPEILRYFQDIADKYDLYRFIKLRHQVIGATWNEETSRWYLKIRNLETGEIIDDWCDFMINGSGVLKYPSSTTANTT